MFVALDVVGQKIARSSSDCRPTVRHLASLNNATKCVQHVDMRELNMGLFDGWGGGGFQHVT
jgi:hypothetical protein